MSTCANGSLIFRRRIIGQTCGQDIHKHRILKVSLGICLVRYRECVLHNRTRISCGCIGCLCDADQRNDHLGYINHRVITYNQVLISLS